jgi:CRISPR-associated RAMP protein (TIGR02581 family)
MHKKLVNEAILELSFSADGPILIKAGESGGLDPTLPDMEFVRTRGQVFIPGSSLKGVIRSHSERIVRSLHPLEASGIGNRKGTCDPLDGKKSCSKQLERLEKREEREGQRRLNSKEKYAKSCFICRLFGNTFIASRIRFTDAMPTTAVRLEERNGVAIDRIFGAVAFGPFNYEVVTEGTFKTRILLKNFTLSQFALLGLALRDIAQGRVAIGFGKSRGLGRVKLAWERLELRYPLAAFKQQTDSSTFYGVGSLANEAGYGFPSNDQVPLPIGMQASDDGWGSLHLITEGDQNVQELFKATIPCWREEVIDG